jgi:hypothetical protein
VLDGIDKGISNDLLAMDIRQALHHLGEITGTITTDDLLDNRIVQDFILYIERELLNEDSNLKEQLINRIRDINNIKVLDLFLIELVKLLKDSIFLEITKA